MSKTLTTTISRAAGALLLIVSLLAFGVACDDESKSTGKAAAPGAEASPPSGGDKAEPAAETPVAEAPAVPGPGEERPKQDVPPEVGETTGTAPEGADPDLRRNDRLAAELALPLYPGARAVPALSHEQAGDLRVVLATNDACERVVRFYEQHTGQVAQTTEISDGNIYDIVLETGQGGEPIHGVQIRQTPRDLAERLSARTSVILFRKKP